VGHDEISSNLRAFWRLMLVCGRIVADASLKLISTIPLDDRTSHSLSDVLTRYLALPPAANRASRAKTVTVCAAQKQNMMAKAAAAGIPLTTFLAAHPAMALVDDRLATEGTGKIFGINDNGLFWNMLAIFTSVWAVFYLSQKDLGGDDGEDSGLTL
jgi:photosystem II PsbW protein